MEIEYSQFVHAPIEVIHDVPPALEKEPPCPSAFLWAGESYKIEQCLSSWRDFNRRGRMGRNMQPAHSARAQLKGSWGVGRFYFRVKTTAGRWFELYYDRAPLSSSDRKGHWFLLAELTPKFRGK